VAEQHHDEESIEEFRETVRTFAQDLVAPHAAEIDRLNAYPEGFEFWRQAGEWGLHGELARGSERHAFDRVRWCCDRARSRQAS
jgi:alkylation response protein AidB-like acyl-CoA dehydrogenase